ncbi:unnamed protein product [Trichobilharzia regenti]|nr:unnamed protein product [Trichobilharzia regenti]
MMSGSDLSDWAFSDPMKVRTRYYAIELGRRLGCPSVQSKEVIQLQEAMYNGYLRYIYKDQYAFKQAFDESYVKQYLNIPYAEQTDAYAVVSCLRYDKKAEEINNIVRDIIPLRGAPTFVWTPVVDGTSGFFPRTPSKERTLGNFAKLPLLAGVVQDEGSLTFQFYLSHPEFYQCLLSRSTTSFSFSKSTRLFPGSKSINSLVTEVS